VSFRKVFVSAVLVVGESSEEEGGEAGVVTDSVFGSMYVGMNDDVGIVDWGWCFVRGWEKSEFEGIRDSSFEDGGVYWRAGEPMTDGIVGMCGWGKDGDESRGFRRWSAFAKEGKFDFSDPGELSEWVDRYSSRFSLFWDDSWFNRWLFSVYRLLFVVVVVVVEVDVVAVSSFDVGCLFLRVCDFQKGVA
jgi:hypothetical protein